MAANIALQYVFTVYQLGYVAIIISFYIVKGTILSQEEEM